MVARAICEVFPSAFYILCILETRPKLNDAFAQLFAFQLDLCFVEVDQIPFILTIAKHPTFYARLSDVILFILCILCIQRVLTSVQVFL